MSCTDSSNILRVLGPLLVFWAGLAAADDAPDLKRGAELFRTHCMTCHGPQGRPDPDSPVVRALGAMPANLADPLFNSREPRSDWKIVVTHGGPALGFSEQMPAFGDVLTENDIDAVLAYVKTLGREHDFPDGELNLFLPIRTKKAFPEDEWVWKQRYTDRDGREDQWRNVLEYEWRIGERWQGVVETIHVSEGSRSELEVIEPGFKYVLAHDVWRGTITTFGGNIAAPLRSTAEWEVLPYLAHGRILSDDWTLQGSARLKLSLEDSDHHAAEFAGIVHWTHTPWPRTVFPALEVVAEVPFERGSGPGRTDAVLWTAVPQVRIGLNRRGHVALNLGLELPLNERDRYEWRGHLFLIWDFADGGFFEGW